MERALGQTIRTLPEPVIPEALLAEFAPRHPFLRDDYLARQGERCDRIYLLTRGYVVLCRRTVCTQEHSLFVLGPGDLFGEEALRGERWQVTAHAVTPGSAYSLPSARLPHYCQTFPKLTGDILAALSRRMEMSQERLDLLLSDGARERVLGFLRMLAARQGKGDDVSLPEMTLLTQSQIGEMLGLARETVARTLSDLEREGIVRREKKRTYLLRTSLTTGLLSALLCLRLLSGPAIYITDGENTEVIPVRGRRGRTHGSLKAPTLMAAFTGPEN